MTNDEGRIRFGMGLDNDKLRIDAGESKNIIHSIANSAEKDGANIEATFRKVGGAIAAAFTAQQALTFAKSVIDVRKEIESLEISFRTLLGSKEKADQLFGQIRQFAVSTPMQLKDLASGAQTLLAFNYEADKVMDTLKALGDISMGDSQKFNSLTLAFAQMNATGKLMAQDLNQMITQGFNPLAVISEKTGKTIGELRKEMEGGAISAQMVEDAFKAATAQGGKFHGMLEAQSKSIGGAISNLQGAIDDMLNDLGEKSQGVFTDVTLGLTDAVKHYREVGEAIAVLVGIYGTYKAAVAASHIVEKSVTALKYKEESTALEALMTQEQRAKVSKLELSASSEAYHAAITGELKAEMQRQIEIARGAQADLTSAKQRLAQAEANKAAAAENVAAKQAELAAVVQEAAAEQAAAITKKMAVESEAQSRAALLAVKLQEQKESLIIEARALKEAGAETAVIEAKQRKIATITQKLAAAKAEEIQHSRNVVALRKEMAAQVDANTSKKIAKAETALATAEENLNTAATERNTAARAVASKRAQVDMAIRRAETIETGMDTAAKGANATATGFLTLAKEKLTTAAAKLNAVILANPYTLAAAAVIALGYGIYKLVTYETDAEKAAKKLNEATNELNASVASERVKIDTLFSRLKAAKKGTDEYRDAKNAILGQYGQYLQGMSKEIQSLEDLEGAYKAVATAAKQAAKERAMESFTKTAADTYAQTESDEKEKLYKFLQKQYGDKKTKSGRSLAEDLYWQLVGSIDGNGTSVREDWLKKFDKTHYVAGSPTLGGMGGYTYTTNEVRDILNKINRAKGIYDTSMQEAERRFGAAPEKKAEEPEKKAEEPAKEPTHNKKYWEDKVKELQGELDAMTDVQLKTDEAAKKRKEIAEAQAKVDAYSVSKTSKAGEKAEKDEAREAVQAAGRTEKLNQYDQKQIVAAREFALAVRQAEIDGDKEGLEKQLKQNKLNYDKLMEQNQKRREEFIETLRDMEELRGENANPDAKDKGKTFDRSSVSASLLTKDDSGAYADISSLPEDQQRIINQMREQLEGYARFAGEEYRRANEESLKAMLGDVQTYEQQREKITEEYARKREAMYEHDADGNRTGLREGVQQGNVDELDMQEKKALQAIDENFAAREETFEVWCNQIGDMTLKQLEELLAKAQEELAAMEKNGASGQQMATARAKVDKLQNAVKKQNAKNELAPKKRTIKEWEDLYRTLDTCANSFKEIGEAVGGTAGKFIKAAGEIASSTISMISGITQLANSSSDAMVGASQAAVASISAVEKASVILTVISAALQVATAIANLFNDDESKQKEIDKLQGRIDQLQWELDNQDIMRYTSVEESLQRVRSAVKATEDAIIEANGWTNKWYGSWLAHTIAIKNEKELTKTAQELAKAYASVEYSANKALGSAKYDEAKSQLESIGKQQVLINEKIAKEKKRKDPNNSEIQEWENKIAELGNKAVEIINGLVEDIIGGSSTDIANELADAFFEAFEAGEDAAKAWGDKVNEIVADIIKKMLIQQYLEKPLGDIFDKYKSKWFGADGTFLGFDAVKNSMDGFAADLKEKGEEFAIIWEGVGKNLKQYFNPDGKFQQDGSTGGFQAMSQDTGDELNGRFTAIQINSEAIKESAISMRGSLEELRNISLLSMGFLEDIEKNTRELYEMNERLDKIAKNTQNL